MAMCVCRHSQNYAEKLQYMVIIIVLALTGDMA